MLDRVGTAIWIENLRSEDRAELLSRDKIESFCDWFTVIGDIRAAGKTPSALRNEIKKRLKSWIRDQTIVVTLSGRGDKDVNTVAERLGDAL